jgi:molybdenum cofactor cytidylyltransferase
VRIAAVVFAAGTSRRMGRNKMLLELEGEPLVRRAARRALEAGLSPVVVVVGFEESLVRAALTGLDVTFAENPEYEGPMSGSMHAALRALPDDAGGAVVILGDMVHVTTAMIRAVADGASSGAPLAVSHYDDVTAPPIFFARILFDELLEWSGEGCGKPVVRNHRDAATYCAWPPDRLADVDTPDDWAREGDD